MSVLDRLKELGVELPQSTPPAAVYVPCVRANGFLFTAGQTPKVNGVLQYRGKADAMPIEEAQKAARMCAINCLTIVNNNGGLDNVERLVKVTGFVNCGLDKPCEHIDADVVQTRDFKILHQIVYVLFSVKRKYLFRR